MIELKPCPFCGGEAKEKTFRSEQTIFCRSRTFIYYECERCEARTKAFPESVEYGAKAKAAEAWNRRPEDEQRD